MKPIFQCLLLFTLVSFVHAADDHVCEFNASYINEKAEFWPTEYVAGKIINVDDSGKHFEFIKNAVYDEKTGEGRSRHCVHWSEQTVFVEVTAAKDFSEIKKPVIVKFLAANDNEAKKMASAADFSAKVATILPDAKDPSEVKTGPQEVVGLFTVDGPRSGTMQIKSKNVKVTVGRRGTKIVIEKNFDVAKLSNGFWAGIVSGAEQNKRFVANRIAVTALPDPREGDDATLPRVLVIGDSISMNYDNAARQALKGVANYHRNEGNSFSSNYGMQYADYWLGNYRKKGFQWDVIQFNHGLHDLKQTGPTAPYAIPLEKYKTYLRKEIEVLKKSGATLIWCSTTPVPNSRGGRYGRQKGAEIAFNKAAMEVMSEYPEIQINDLCRVVNDSTVFDKFRKGSDPHYYKAEEQNVLGKAVADAVIKALK